MAPVVPAHCAESDAQPAPTAHTSVDADSRPGLGSDILAYYTAPLHWSGGEWAIFAGVLASTGIAYHYDADVRTHFVGPAVTSSSSSHDLEDAVPTLAFIVGTWGYSALIDNDAGRSEAWQMVEAAGLSGVTSYALQFAFAREGPDTTNDPHEWFKGGLGSFPSAHVTGAFAVGTVFAESGSDDFRLLRRFLGYGLGVGTAYARLHHNQHWLSDVVAGAALGTSTGFFVMARHEQRQLRADWQLVPVPGGAMLTYNRVF
jgi:membrane-associated phospholipid phosphatase